MKIRRRDVISLNQPRGMSAKMAANGIQTHDNIYAKTVRKEYSTPHKHPIASARGFEGVLKAPPTEALALTAFSLTKRHICKLY